MRRTNIQHARKRARPRSVMLPAVLAGLLVVVAAGGVFWSVVMLS